MNILETKVLELIGESPDDPDVFTDTDAGIAPIRDSINDAIQEITMLTGGHKRKYIIPLRKNQAFYRFRLQNGYFGWITDAWDINRDYRLTQTDLVALKEYDPRWMVGNGLPEKYVQLGTDVIGFYRKPSTSANAIELSIVEIPDPYDTSTERIKLRDSYQYAAINYAVGEYWASRGDAAEAANYGIMYLDALGLKDRYSLDPGYVRKAETQKEVQ